MLQVEAILLSCPLVDNLMVHADSLRNFVVAIVVPHHNNLSQWAKSEGLDSIDFASLCKHPAAIAQVQQALEKV